MNFVTFALSASLVGDVGRPLVGEVGVRLKVGFYRCPLPVKRLWLRVIGCVRDLRGPMQISDRERWKALMCLR